MKKEDLNTEISNLAFDFFYWFSRFEFALKENHYLKSHKPGARAEPGWRQFVGQWHAHFEASIESRQLFALLPEQQVVADGSQVAWDSVNLDDCKSELEAVVLLLKTVRNNLFHGGKHGGAGWDNPKRTEALLRVGKEVLDQLAILAGFEHDYTQHY